MSPTEADWLWGQPPPSTHHPPLLLIQLPRLGKEEQAGMEEEMSEAYPEGWW